MAEKSAKLFIYGDRGAVLITSAGSRRLPPFSISIQKQLKSLNELVHAAHYEIGNKKQNIQQQVNRLSNQVVGALEDIVGPLDPEAGVVYDDVDGGFTCGSTGKPPIPIPPEPQPYAGVGELLERGVVDSDMLEFLTKVNAKSVNQLEAFENPSKVAEDLGIKISLRTEHDLNALASSKLNDIDHEEIKELIEFLHSVIKDGRYVDEWMARPAHVADELGLELGPKTLEEIMQMGSIKDQSHAAAPALAVLVTPVPISAGVVATVAVVAVVATVVSSSAGRLQTLVIDRSNIKKL